MSAKWEEIYTPDDIRRIQEIELDSLRVFRQVCDKLGIEFFLYGGSLLGAVKYNGFIPWDDDLDLALMREDYELLLKEGPGLLPEKYELQHPAINRVTPYPYIKLRRTDTVMAEYYVHKLNMNHGVYFDIYPIDNLPDDDRQYQQIHRRVQRLLRAFNLRQICPLLDESATPMDRIKYPVKLLRHAVLRLVPHGYLVKRLKREMTRFNSVETVRKGNYFFAEPVNYFDGVLPLLDVAFEGMTLKIPRGYAVNLTNRYGDISELPPEDERVGHIPYILSIGGYKNAD